ncbi:MAG TPA: hypothetical protein VJC21_05410 [Candidatus Nanoarchaeia archaeon]|nr:hypothetical protein [Candidatus Nanoarchaeia archaeon]
MIVRAEGLKAWLLILVVFLGVLVLLVIIFQVLIFLLPLILVLLLMAYLFRKLNTAKKSGKKKDFIDIVFNVKK